MTNKKSLVKALKKMYTTTSVTDPFNGAACCIDEKGNFGNWLEDAMNRKRWEWLIDCQLKRAHLKINPPQESADGANYRNYEPPPPPPPPPSPRGSDPPSPPPRSRNNDGANSLLNASLNLLGLPPGATAREAKVKFRQLCRTYHPDKHKHEKTGLTDAKAMHLFQQYNNAYEFVKDKLN